MNSSSDSHKLDLGRIEVAQVLSYLECPVCLDYIAPPVRQCIKGHLVCNDCFPRLNTQCPTCRSALTEERNLAIEKLAYLLKYPCKFQLRGCSEILPLDSKAAHEQRCVFKKLRCPFHGNCNFDGNLSDVAPHLASAHKVIPITVQTSGSFFYRAKNCLSQRLWVFIFKWDHQLFRFSARNLRLSEYDSYKGQALLAHVHVIGPVSLATHYTFQICIFDAYNRQNMFTQNGSVMSFLSTDKETEWLNNTNNDFMVPIKEAWKFSDDSNNINFIVKINKVEDSRSCDSSNSAKDSVAPAEAGASQPSTSARQQQPAVRHQLLPLSCQVTPESGVSQDRPESNS